MCILSYSVRRPSQTTRGNISIIQMVSKNRYITLWKTWIHARLDRWATMLCHVTPSIPPRVPCHVSLSLGGFRLAFLRPLCPSIHFCVKNHVTFFRMNWKEKRRAALPYQQVSDVVSVVFFFCIACISKTVKCHTSVPYDGEIKVGSSFDENTNRKGDRLQLFLFKSIAKRFLPLFFGFDLWNPLLVPHCLKKLIFLHVFFNFTVCHISKHHVLAKIY